MSRDIASIEPASSGRVVARTALTPAVWGTTYLVATEFLPAGRPLFAAVVRALPVGLLFLLVTRRLPSGEWWWKSVVLGVLNIGAFFALLFVAAFRLPGGVAATAGALQPLIAAGLAALFLREALTRAVVAAGVTGVVGVGLLVLGPDASLDAVGVAAAIGGTLSMAVGVLLTKAWGRPTDLLTFTGWQLSAGGLFLLPLLLVIEGLPESLTARHGAGIVWLALVGTGLAYANWFRGIPSLPVAAAAALGLLSPLVATLLGWVVLDQSLSVVQLVGVALVLASVLGPHVAGRRAAASAARRAASLTTPGRKVCPS